MRYSQSINRWNFTLGDYKCKVVIPHTWNTDDEVMKYRGTATYETKVYIDDSNRSRNAFLTFNAVYHTAAVFVNGKPVGTHTGSGFTPFRLNITDAVIWGADNSIRVEVDNTHIDTMLPHGDDFDWSDDGGIIRRVTLELLESGAIEYAHITEEIESMKDGLGCGTLHITTNTSAPCKVKLYDYATGALVLTSSSLTIPFKNLKLWSCYTPSLYTVTIESAGDIYETRIGIRKIETKGTKVYLNGEEIYLKGCEWMPGSHPDFGMAEPLDHSIRCLRMLKAAGCVFTRFHWQQDDTLFDWCDENGLLVQEEIPYWGYPKEATSLQYEIAARQADEMMMFHFNHPSIVCWGVGNELGADKEPTIDYVKNIIRYFKEKDSRRLVNYVSNTLSLVTTIGKDDATLYGDIAMWNDYLGLWEPTDNIPEHMKRTCLKASDKPLLVSEFGLCEPHFKGGDSERSRILSERLALYKGFDNICGYMWFSLNDYRTHCGEEGADNMRRRVHGSSDLYGNSKPSYELLRKYQCE